MQNAAASILKANVSAAIVDHSPTYMKESPSIRRLPHFEARETFVEQTAVQFELGPFNKALSFEIRGGAVQGPAADVPSHESHAESQAIALRAGG